MNIYDALILKAVGGGGGTTVVANPEGEATDELEKLQVGSDIYEIPKDYEEMSNKPSINSVELSGNKTASELGLQAELDGTQTVSGNPITVTDAESMNAESVVVELEPKQDLHGYDAPWVGGAGKNKLEQILADIKSNNTSGTWSGNVYAINGGTVEVLVDSANNVLGFKANGTFTAISTFNLYVNGTLSSGNYILNGCPSGASSSTYKMDMPNASFATDMGSGVSFTANGTTKYYVRIVLYAGSIANKTFYPMIRLATETDPTFAPYSNICPITGYSEVNVERVGKNLCDHSTITDGVALGGHGGTYPDGTACTTDFIFVKAGEDVAFSAGFRWGNVYDLNENFTETQFFTTYHAEENCLIRVTFDLSAKSTIQVEYSSTTTYEPYQSNTYTIDLDGTKYGGTLDVTEGVLTVTHSFVQTTWGEMTNPQVSGDYTFKTIPNLNCKSTGDAVGNLCNLTDNEASNLNQNVHYWCQENLGAVVSLLSDTPNDTVVQIYYELATPLTIHLTPTQIQMLENTNNISTDGTNITLKYQPNNVIGECKAYTDEKCSEVLPPLPTTDGTYHLSCEVTSGVGVLSWVSDS